MPHHTAETPTSNATFTVPNTLSGPKFTHATASTTPSVISVAGALGESVHVTRSNRHRRKKKIEYSGLPQLSFPAQRISTRNVPYLQHPTLKNLAFALAKIDRYSLIYSKTVLEDAKATRTPSPGMNCAVELAAVEAAIAQITNGIEGLTHFTESYLRSLEFLKSWKLKRSKFIAHWRSLPVKEVARNENLLKLIAKDLSQLSKALVEVAQYKMLEQAYKDALNDRWNVIIEIFDSFSLLTGIQIPVPTWIEAAAQLTEMQLITSSQVLDLDCTSTLMWPTFLEIVLLALPTFALAYQHSSHKPETIQDADFWFQVQASSMTFLGLLIMGIPMWKERMLSGYVWYWTWGAMSISGACSFSAPVIYCYAPIEWASLGIVAGALQAFVTL
ncbi:uncharacterized protein BP5553_08233 [Venustampulla echinocandica]|uniref:Uncharacterized protein n=1 Tax=Venustampulla echinocandica TaxID=2656787 RepID=A0A370TG46_9HELO|nr:uncharacterized protein BP5553_08233 [Venustampulla echinocandica]RDL33865.1 hypothetical protein BP5553_08233 [Venustampulla echinocandica]